MTAKVLRGRVLSFNRRPESAADGGAYAYFEDGGILIAGGKVGAVGTFDAVQAATPAGTPVTDHRPHLITAGFIDPHVHFVQMQVIASYAANLLEWLDTYTFVEEQKFADIEHCAKIATAFFDELIRQGTTTAAAYCSVHTLSVDAFFAEAQARNMCMVGGKVMMDRNAPAALTDSAASGYEQSVELIDKWHGRGRCHYAITPRFALTSTPAQLEAAGALAKKFPECFVQTHMDENRAEIVRALDLYPDAADYAGIYDRYGLLGRKTLLGHCIHLEQREIELIADAGSVAVHCPTSNLFLGSGLMDMAGLHSAGVRTAVATDIGGGTSYSMLRTLDEGYKVGQLRGGGADPLLSFYMATRGNAAALSLDDRIGSIGPGLDADLIVLNAGATPASALRLETVKTLAEELFLLQTLGDDRMVAETYIAGEPAKSRLRN
ncbi:MAG: guanine deaminase [Alphaproteobacteria bacterium]|nr:guanine deaminase [Alphaproteobacteria bacterium]